MPNVYAYGRASTEDQELTEHGQRHDCMTMIAERFSDYTWNDSHWFYDHDTGGGTHMDQRQYGRLLLYTIKPGDIIVFQRLDRMFRNSTDALKTKDWIHEKGGMLWFYTQPNLDVKTPEGELMFTVLAGVARLEKRFISDRTSTGLQTLKRQGKRYGRRIPDGWMKDRDGFKPDMAERKVAEEFALLRDAGVSLREIARLYYRRPRRRGTSWDRNTIRKILINRQKGFPKILEN
jgi:DNA invertase Pin-like site-specific DNA recombinase